MSLAAVAAAAYLILCHCRTYWPVRQLGLSTCCIMPICVVMHKNARQKTACAYIGPDPTRQISVKSGPTRANTWMDPTRAQCQLCVSGGNVVL